MEYLYTSNAAVEDTDELPPTAEMTAAEARAYARYLIFLGAFILVIFLKAQTGA